MHWFNVYLKGKKSLYVMLYSEVYLLDSFHLMPDLKSLNNVLDETKIFQNILISMCLLKHDV